MQVVDDYYCIDWLLHAQKEAPNAVEAVTQPERETEVSHPMLDSDAPTVRHSYTIAHGCGSIGADAAGLHAATAMFEASHRGCSCWVKGMKLHSDLQLHPRLCKEVELDALYTDFHALEDLELYEETPYQPKT